MRLLKEIYLTWFVICFHFRIAAWPAAVESGISQGRGVAGVSSIQAMLIATAIFLSETLGGAQIPRTKWMIGAAFLLLCFINQFVLVHRGHGMKFLSTFAHLKTKKKRLLIALSSIAIFMDICLFLFAATLHRHYFKPNM